MNRFWQDFDFQALGWTLIHSVWQIALVAVVLRILLLLLSPRHARIRYSLGILALSVAVILPAKTWLSGISDSSISSTIGASVANLATQTTETPTLPILQDVPASLNSVSAGAPPSVPSSTSDRLKITVENYFPWLVTLWVLGFLLFSLRPLIGWWSGRSLCRAAHTLPAPEMESRARTLARRFGLTRTIRVALSNRVDVPMIIGFVRPVILFPVAAAAGMSAREIDTILVHELAHLRRWDYWVNLFQSIVEAVFFYHPAVWWMSSVVRSERENCCDDVVLEEFPDRTTYLRALAFVESSRPSRPSLSLASDGGSLVRRVRRIANRDHTRPTLAGLSMWMIPVAVVLGTLGSAMAVEPDGKESPAIVPRVEDFETLQRINLEAYQSKKPELEAMPEGSWAIIVQGTLSGPFPSFETATQAADDAGANDLHRFIFRPGVDDFEGEFVHSPWMDSDPSWYQFGLTFRKKFPLTISSYTWSRRGKTLQLPENGRGSVRSGAPGGELNHSFSAVISPLFKYDVTITDDDASKLQLDRFAVPGVMTCLSPKRVCRKAHIHIAIPELDIDTRLIAIIMKKQKPGGKKSFPNVNAEQALIDELLSKTNEKTFVVQGRVTDDKGAPLQGVTLKANCGIGTLRTTGTAQTDANGRYTMTFGPGMRTQDPDTGEWIAGVQAATIFASLDGYCEKDLCRGGDRLMASERPEGQTPWGDGPSLGDKLIVAGEPATQNFTMVRAATIEGYLIDHHGMPITRRNVALDGDPLPPSSSVLRSVQTNDRGFFTMNGIPTTQDWYFVFRIPSSRRAVNTEPERFEEPKIHRVLLTLNKDNVLSSQPLNHAHERALLSNLVDFLSTQTIRGNKHTQADDWLTWGEAKNGLQAAFRWTDERKTFRLGDRIPLEFVIRNVSDQVIRFDSTSWRQEDTLRIRRKDGGGLLDVGKTWYSGWPIVVRYELRPGEQVALTSAAIGLGKKEQSFPHPVVYTIEPKAGIHIVEFRLRFPDVRQASRENQGTWEGILYTGEVELKITI